MISRRPAAAAALAALALSMTACGPEAKLSLSVRERQLDVAYGDQKPKATIPGLERVPYNPPIGAGGYQGPTGYPPVYVPFDPATQVPFGTDGGLGALPQPTCPKASAKAKPKRPLSSTVTGFPITFGTYGYSQKGTLKVGSTTYPLPARLGRIVASAPGKDPVDGHDVQYVGYVYGQASNLTAVVLEVDTTGALPGIKLAGFAQLDPQDISTGLFSTLLYLPNVPTKVVSVPVVYETAALQEPTGVSSGVSTPALPDLIQNLLPTPPVTVNGAVATTFDGLGQPVQTAGPTHQTVGKRSFFACGEVVQAYDVSIIGTFHVHGGRGAVVNINATWTVAPQYGGMIVGEQMRLWGTKYGTTNADPSTPYELTYTSTIESLKPLKSPVKGAA
jgi:hypothetical protein